MCIYALGDMMHCIIFKVNHESSSSYKIPSHCKKEITLALKEMRTFTHKRSSMICLEVLSVVLTTV